MTHAVLLAFMLALVACDAPAPRSRNARNQGRASAAIDCRPVCREREECDDAHLMAATWTAASGCYCACRVDLDRPARAAEGSR